MAVAGHTTVSHPRYRIRPWVVAPDRGSQFAVKVSEYVFNGPTVRWRAISFILIKTLIKFSSFTVGKRQRFQVGMVGDAVPKHPCKRHSLCDWQGEQLVDINVHTPNLRLARGLGNY
jgi:hypothetical protein